MFDRIVRITLKYRGSTRLRSPMNEVKPSRFQIIRSTILLGIIRLGLIIFPFCRLRGILERLLPERRKQIITARAIARSVVLAGRYVPAINCLSSALACQLLLLREGYEPELQVGVLVNPAQGLEAHSWVRLDGEILIGDTGNIKKYATLEPTQV